MLEFCQLRLTTLLPRQFYHIFFFFMFTFLSPFNKDLVRDEVLGFAHFCQYKSLCFYALKPIFEILIAEFL